MNYLFNRISLLSSCRRFHICKKNLTSGNHGHGFSAERLVQRQLLRISGDTSSEFLQGLITNDMRYLERDQPSLYCMFLNTKGRVLFDSIIYRTKDKNVFYIECDGQCISQLIKHLSIYKVRRKIDISSVDSELSTWAIYNVELVNKCCLDGEKKNYESRDFTFDTTVIANELATVVPDPRLPFLGYRAVIRKGEDITCLPKSDCYNIIRYKLGIAEGIDEFQVGQNFPLEMNCDYLKGVSFDKGCYIGQELTARTFHTGVIRKRLMPLVFNETPNDIPLNTSIDDPDVQRKTPLGKLKAVKGNYGLGLMRVAETLAAKTLKVLDYAIKPITPFWWPDLLQLNKSSSLNK